MKPPQLLHTVSAGQILTTLPTLCLAQNILVFFGIHIYSLNIPPAPHHSQTPTYDPTTARNITERILP